MKVRATCFTTSSTVTAMPSRDLRRVLVHSLVRGRNPRSMFCNMGGFRCRIPVLAGNAFRVASVQPDDRDINGDLALSDVCEVAYARVPLTEVVTFDWSYV